jgi:uncharacterized membrane protein YbaN (DUF454 family)
VRDIRSEADGGDDAVREHASPIVRGLLLVAGTAFVALGLIGLFVPVLPTTPFMLLAAACYARASKRFYYWLLSNRTFGPMIHEWRKHRSIPYRTKVAAIGMMLVTLSISIILFVRPAWLQVALAAGGLALAVWMYRLPSRDRVRR